MTTMRASFLFTFNHRRQHGKVFDATEFTTEFADVALRSNLLHDSASFVSTILAAVEDAAMFGMYIFHKIPPRPSGKLFLSNRWRPRYTNSSPRKPSP
jgi:hypothetical protein